MMRMNVFGGRRARAILAWLAVALIVTLVIYRLKFAPVPVVAEAVRMRAVAGEVMGTGTLEARVKTVISSRIQERLAEVPVDQGDIVSQGQLLARLDDGELGRRVEVEKAALESAVATLRRVRTDDARAVAIERQARIEHDRTSALLDDRVSARAELDKAVERLAVAEAEAKRARAAIAEAEGEASRAEKNLRYHEERLSFARIVSPYAGLIVRRDRDPGGIVVPGGAIVQMISTNELWVSAWVDETAMAGLAVGQPARVVFRSDPETSYPGEVARLGREADRETREFVVDVRAKGLPRNWAVGQRAEVYIETGRRDAVVALALRFVAWRDGAPGTFVEVGGRARWRAIELGLRGAGIAEVTSGLSPGEVVYAAKGGGGALEDGRRVSVR